MKFNALHTALALSCSLAMVPFTQGELIAYDGFQYGVSANLQGANGGDGWTSHWAKLSAIPTGVALDNLTWPGLPTNGNSAFTAPYPSADFTRYSRAFAPYTDPDDTIYVSFLVRPNVGHGVEAGIAFGTWEDGMVVGARPSGMYGLMTPPNTLSSDSNVAVVQGQTALMVACISKNDDATITWSLYVDPVVGQLQPHQPDATITVPGTTLPGAMSIFNDGGFSTDEIRVAQTWASALPTNVVSGDATGDGIVGIQDLLTVIGAWGACGNPCPADVSHDGVVGIQDLLMVIGNWS